MSSVTTNAERGQPSPQRERALRPKDAGALIVLDRSGADLRVLMGRRSHRHVFMPGYLVFPGGRIEAADRHAPAASELDPIVEAKLLLEMRERPSRARARAIALAALRETYEEAGLVIGERGSPARPVRNGAWRPYVATGVVPALGRLALVARAITPPNRIRRFDARFFAVFADAVAATVEPPQDELVEPAWLTFAEARAHPLAEITRLIFDDLEARLAADPDLGPDGPVPLHSMRRGRRVREWL
ncbi:NUDIX hydrolase [Propylenella binzhouense]|uniref:NUDIX hydrolase n=1 Tax=Propylenella binzhouense TaxID=2555902 RepID=A0A964T349_9HYPH|nr:NUDIX hydrolase [Propylenella binzhouense]